MDSVLKSCLEAYEEAAASVGSTVTYQEVSTPFIDEDDTPNPAMVPVEGEDGFQCP